MSSGERIRSDDEETQRPLRFVHNRSRLQPRRGPRHRRRAHRYRPHPNRLPDRRTRCKGLRRLHFRKHVPGLIVSLPQTSSGTNTDDFSGWWVGYLWSGRRLHSDQHRMPAAWHFVALRFQNVEGDEESADLAKKLKEMNATEATRAITVLLVGRKVCLYIGHQIINPLLLFDFLPFLVL